MERRQASKLIVFLAITTDVGSTLFAHEEGQPNRHRDKQQADCRARGTETSNKPTVGPEAQRQATASRAKTNSI